MNINGIGEVNKEIVMSILTNDGVKAVEAGDITLKEVGEMYKLKLVRSFCKCGKFGDTFRANLSRVADNIYDKLPPADIAQLIDAFYKCYEDGKMQSDRIYLAQ